nr:immunoglobulin heavy chain junction region [Macaca mulatta]
CGRADYGNSLDFW